MIVKGQSPVGRAWEVVRILLPSAPMNEEAGALHYVLEEHARNHWWWFYQICQNRNSVPLLNECCARIKQT